MLDNIPTILIIFGATGDLSTTKLMPSLYNLDKKGMTPDQFKILAVGRQDLSSQSYTADLENLIQTKFPHLIDDLSWSRFSTKVNYIKGDFNNEQTFIDLAEQLNETDNNFGVCTHKIFYLAISPDHYKLVLDGIKTAQLREICQNQKDARIVIEKPFGRDLTSFSELNNLLLESFTEEQIYRIDHYLGKETVQNLLYFRAANPILSNNWSKEHIDSIEIMVMEADGIRNRGSYYDAYGQTRDMLQSHLLQLLAIIVMDLPASMDMVELGKEKAKVLEGLLFNGQNMDIIRGQYAEGIVEGKEVLAYRSEKDISQDSQTETLIQLNAELTYPGWEGVGIKLTTAKRMPKKETKIVINFKKQKVFSEVPVANKLIFMIQPDEGISLTLNIKQPGKDKLEQVAMKFAYQDNFKALLPEAYEKILLDILRMNKVNFLKTEELIASWKFVDQLRAFWEQHTKLIFYKAGSTSVLN